MGIRDARWLALAIATEDIHSTEQSWIGRVIRNRKETSYRWKTDYLKVVLDRYQFSHFNPWVKVGDAGPLAVLSDDELFEAIIKGTFGGVHLSRRLTSGELWDAAEVASRVLLEPWPHPDCPPDTLHFYAPRSMRPRGSRPVWAKTAKRLWTPEGCDPDRLVLAQGAP
jgi:hypothetical protein